MVTAESFSLTETAEKLQRLGLEPTGYLDALESVLQAADSCDLETTIEELLILGINQQELYQQHLDALQLLSVELVSDTRAYELEWGYAILVRLGENLVKDELRKCWR